MKRTMTTKLAAAGSLAVLAFAGAACQAGDGGTTSPGQEVPADGGVGGDTGGETGGDLGGETGGDLGGETGGDTGADTTG